MDFIKHLVEHETSKTSIKSKPLSISEKLNTINTLDGVLNVPRTRITDVGILERKVTDKMADRYQHVLRRLKIIQVWHTHVVSSQELFSPTLFTGYPV
jgi:hypothetical protein